MTKEVLTLALEALKYSDTVFYPQTSIAIAAIERALAQPEQGEPVAWIHIDPEKPKVRFLEWKENKLGYRGKWIKKPLYTNPPQRTWVGLKDEDCDEVERWVEFKEEGSGRIPIQKLIRYIEAKLKGKNT
jgi:hypothetical protein